MGAVYEATQLDGQRFWNEHEGYSEASQHVIRQREGLAWNIYDARLHALGMSFPDYAELFATGATTWHGCVAAAMDFPDTLPGSLDDLFQSSGAAPAVWLTAPST